MCVQEFENWYKKSFLVPEEELDITIDRTLEQVSLPHIYNIASLMEKMFLYSFP